MVKRLLVAGGDRRMLLLAGMLENAGYEVHTLGLKNGDEKQNGIAQADVLLFAYPFSVKNGFIPTLTGVKLEAENVVEKIKGHPLVIGGRGLEPYALSRDTRPQRFHLKQYAQAEGFEEKNAAVSAEAAVYEAMLRLEYALMDIHVLVTGYGAFGRALALRLHALGARVCIAARREEAREQARRDGLEAVRMEEMAKVLACVDLVMNTVPARILDEKALRCLSPQTWLMELASAPYGFDRDLAHALGLRTALLPGLPAAYAPFSAALALKEAVLSLLKEA